MSQCGGLRLERSHLLTGTGEHECTQVEQGFAGNNDDDDRFQQRWCYGCKTPYTKFMSAYFFFRWKRNIYIYKHFPDYDLT